MKRPRVLLTGTGSILRAVLEKSLESEHKLVGAASNNSDLFKLASSGKPDVIVLDVSVRDFELHRVTKRLRRLVPETKLLVLAENKSLDQVRQAFLQGVTGYLLKTSEIQELSLAIRESLEGRAYVTPIITDNLANSLFLEAKHVLTPRQQEVLRLLIEGHSMKKIAGILKLKPRTVAFHKYRIMSQLGVSSSAELIRYAIKHGIG